MLGLFYILFNTSGMVVKFVNKIVTNLPAYHTFANLKFVFETMSDTIDVGFYILPLYYKYYNFGTNWSNGYKIRLDIHDHVSISIFKLLGDNTIPTIQSLTIPSITSAQ